MYSIHVVCLSVSRTCLLYSFIITLATSLVLYLSDVRENCPVSAKEGCLSGSLGDGARVGGHCRGSGSSWEGSRGRGVERG